MKFKKGIIGILTMALIMMSISSVPFFTVSAATAATQYLVSNCDTSWDVGPTDPAYKVEGTGSIAYNTTGPTTLVFQDAFSPINVSLSEADAGVSFWFYVSDPTGITLSVFNLTSSGGPDSAQYQWTYEPTGWYYDYDASVPTLVAGWNHIVMPFSEASKVGTPNLNALNFVRAYLQFGATTKTFAVDDVRIVDYKKTIKSVTQPTVNTTTGTGFADAMNQVTVDAVTYGGSTIKSIPVNWNKKNYQSSITGGCTVTGTFPASVMDKYGIIDTNVPITASVNVNSSSVATTKYLISNCDTAAFVGTTSTLDTQNKVEGTGSVTATQAGAGMIIMQKSFTAVNPGITDSNGALDIWIYIENVDKTVTTQIELSSNPAGEDTKEYHWDGVDNINLNKGWNRLILKLNQIGTKIGAVDITSISYFRFYTIFGSNNVTNTIKIDSVKLIDWTELNFNALGTVVSNCDSSAAVTGWEAPFYVQNGLYKEGTGAFQLSANSTFVAGRHFPTPLNTGATETDGALSMWVYSSKTLINDGASAIELTSGGTFDLDEYQWDMPALNLKIGWNYLTLYFSDAIKKGNPNLSAINYFRIYDVGATNNTFFLDDIRVVSGESTNAVNFVGYKTYGDEITNIFPNTTEADFRANLKPASGTTLNFANLAAGKVGTGTTIDVTVAGNVIKTYKAIIYGDANGDSLIDLNDLVTVKQHILKINTLTLDNFAAADALNSGDISISDLLAIKKSIIGISDISQSPALRTFVSKPLLVTPTFASEDVVVADYVVTSPAYNADNTGVLDSTAAIQSALNDCYTKGGGTVWMPAGTYKVTNTIKIPSFVTLKGDWRDPDSGSGSYGTVVKAMVASGDSGPTLFQIGGSAGVVGITTYYPNQSSTTPVPYNYTFNITGNENNGDLGTYMCASIINCTMLNSYRGISAGALDNTKVHEMATVKNVKGTALYRGVAAYNSAEVGTWENITFNNSYWANAGASYNAPSVATLNTFTRANATAYTFGDNEFEQFYALSCSDYNIGINIVAGSRTKFSGEMLWVSVLNSNTAVLINANSIYPTFGLSFLRSVLTGSTSAITNNSLVGETSYVKICDSVLTGGINGAGVAKITQTSPGTTPTSYEGAAIPKVTRSVLYDVTKAPYSAPYSLPQTGLPSSDATSAIQQALTDAGNAGGGVVYLPAGWYRINSHLTVPANVELRGSSSVPNRDQHNLSYGTSLIGYEGHNTANPDSATAMITLNGDTSGISGLKFFYPNNNPDIATLVPYPYTIRGNGANQYVVNVSLSGVYNGIDFAASRCDNHHIIKVSGVAYSKFITVGTSTVGYIEGCLSNPTAAIRNQYSVPGWAAEANIIAQIINPITRANETFITIYGSSNEHLLNNFVYGAQYGINVASSTAVNIFNFGTDNLSATGYGVVGTAGTIKMMNYMRFNGAADTIGAVTVYNSMVLTN